MKGLIYRPEPGLSSWDLWVTCDLWPHRILAAHGRIIRWNLKPLIRQLNHLNQYKHWHSALPIWTGSNLSEAATQKLLVGPGTNWWFPSNNVNQLYLRVRLRFLAQTGNKVDGTLDWEKKKWKKKMKNEKLKKMTEFHTCEKVFFVAFFKFKFGLLLMITQALF